MRDLEHKFAPLQQALFRVLERRATNIINNVSSFKRSDYRIFIQSLSRWDPSPKL